MKGLIKILLLIFFVSCSNVPLTERKQINLLPESQMVAMALTSYSDFLKEHPPVVNSNADAQMVKRVGERVKDAVVQYMRDHNLYDRIKD